MANIKISELPQASTVNDTDVIPIVQDGTTKQATAGMISPTVATSITSSSTNNEVAGAKAVYDFVSDYKEFINNITSMESHLSLRSGGLNYIRKMGNIVYINLCFNYTAGFFSAGGKTMCMLPNEVIPTGSVYFVANAVDYPNKFNCWLSNAGELKIYVATGNTSAAGTIYLSGTYFVDTATTNSLNTASLMNTGSLVGMGDRAELTSFATDNEELEKVETKTESNESGDITNEIAVTEEEQK